MNILYVPISHDRKTGCIEVTYTSFEACPKRCPWASECYGRYYPCCLHADRLNRFYRLDIQQYATAPETLAFKAAMVPKYRLICSHCGAIHDYMRATKVVKDFMAGRGSSYKDGCRTLGTLSLYVWNENLKEYINF